MLKTFFVKLPNIKKNFKTKKNIIIYSFVDTATAASCDDDDDDVYAAVFDAAAA